MNIAELQRLLSAGDCSPNALTSLIAFRAECEWLDFKLKLELTDDKQLCDFAKDVLAMRNTGGGYVVVGVRDRTWEPVGMDRPLALDSKQLCDKLDRALGVRLEVIVVSHSLNVRGQRRWFAIIHVPIPSTSESNPELEFVARDFRTNERFGLTAGWTYARRGDETVKIVSGRQFEIARLKLGKAVADANYYRTIDRLSSKIEVTPTTLSGLVEGASQSVVEVEDELAVFSGAPERRVLSAPEATSAPTGEPQQSGTLIPVVISLDARQMNVSTISRIKAILSAHRGSSPVQLQLRGARSTMVVRLGKELWVDPRKGLYAELKAALGDKLIT